MKKYIVISIIAIVALLPFAAWADEGGEAFATIYFEAVINTIVTSHWDDLTITQDVMEDWLEASMPMDWGDPLTPGTHDIEVTVQSFTDYEVYASYYSNMAAVFSGDVLYLTESGGNGFFGYLDYLEIADPAGGGDGVGMTDLGWTGTNNLPDGDHASYDVSWNPGNIDGDLQKEDEFYLHIVFIVTDTYIR